MTLKIRTSLNIGLRAFFLVCLCTPLLNCTKTNQLTKQEKSMLVTERDFTDYEISKETNIKGQYHKEHIYLDHSTTLEYEASVNENTYLMNSFSLEKSSRDATTMAFTMRTGALIGLKFGDLKSEELLIKNQHAGKATLLLLKSDNKPVGNVFTYVQDNKVWFILFSGFYYDNAKDFEVVFAPHIQKIQAFSTFDS